MRLLKTGFIFFSIAVIFASCAPAPIIRSVRAGDQQRVQGDIGQGNNINARYHAQDLRWCWIPLVWYPMGLVCPFVQLTDKSTPLITAIGEKDIPMVKFLIDHGADVNASATYFLPHFGQSGGDLPPLILASGSMEKDPKNEEIVRILLSHGANIEAIDSMWGGTPLMWAAWRGHPNIVKLLLDHGANVHAVCDKCVSDKTALDWADCFGSAHNPEVISLITAALRNNAPVQVASSEPRQESSNSSSEAIFKAARDGDDDRVRSLIRQGVDINATDSYGFTPLMWAAYEGQTDTAEILLKAGAHLTMTNRDGDTALMIAADKGHLDMVKLLFKHGAPLNARDEKGFTALMWAEKRHHHNVVKFLKENGARGPQARNQLKSKPEAQKADAKTQSSKPEEPVDVNSVLP